MQEQHRRLRGSYETFARPAAPMAAVLLILASGAAGQIIKFNPFGQKPKVPVTIKHPATLGMNLTGKKVAFGPVHGACPQQKVFAVANTQQRRQVQ